MTPIEKIQQGMKLMKAGCSEHRYWNACEECPFSRYCDFMAQQTDRFSRPSNWNIKKLRSGKNDR